MRTIAGFAAALTRVRVGPDVTALWRVRDLERHVDRAALLGGAEAPDPPYWAHLWSGAVVLAEVIPPRAGRVLELGCGVGLPGLVAARRGAQVTFLDRAPEALAFVRASGAANGVPNVRLVVADFTAPPLRTCFDLVLAAEVLYDRRVFGTLARVIRDHLAPGGRALVADAGRVDTRTFYDELGAAGLRFRTDAHAVREEGLPLSVTLVEISSVAS
jgi:predicted nicotinamide N-methyase